jgi:hypothetical protein
MYLRDEITQRMIHPKVAEAYKKALEIGSEAKDRANEIACPTGSRGGGERT